MQIVIKPRIVCDSLYETHCIPYKCVTCFAPTPGGNIHALGLCVLLISVLCDYSPTEEEVVSTKTYEIDLG